MGVPETSQESIDPAAKPAVVPTARIDRSLSTWRVVLALALPVLAQQFLVLVVGLSDRFLAGHMVRPEDQAEVLGHRLLALGALGGSGGALNAEISWEAARQVTERQVAYQAAQTTAQYLAWVINSYIALVTVGSTALVARFIGARNRTQAIHATNQSLLLGAAFGIAGSIVGLVGTASLVSLLQLRGEAASLATEYLRPLLALLLFQLIESAGIACLIGAGDTVTGLWVMTGVAIVNVPLAWGFCRGLGPLPELGFSGISLGTAVSHVLGGVAVLLTLWRGRAGLRLIPHLLWPNTDLIVRLLRISVPAGLDSLSIVAFQLWFLGIVNRLGTVAAGAHGIALGWEALGYLSGAAFGTAAMALVGQNLGAGKPKEAARSGWIAFAIGCGVMCMMGVVFFVLAPQMFAIFCPNPEQREIVKTGVPVLQLIAFAMPALASCMVFTFALRGAGDTRVPVIFTWVGFLGVRIPLAYLFTFDQLDLGMFGTLPALHLGLIGAWLAMVADVVVRGGFFLYRFASGRWQSIQV